MNLELPEPLAARIRTLATLAPLMGTARRVDTEEVLLIEVVKEGLRSLEQLCGAQREHGA